ncbi:MAG: cytidylate kinase family protein [Burkholderiales bacterium]
MPLIAMTREMGSLGKDVAAGIAQRLGKPVVHHEIIDNLANKMRLRKSHVIRFLEGKSSLIERLTTDKTSLHIFTADETFDLAAKGDVSVIRGWGAAHLLRSVPHVIGVRVCAPFELRVDRMMARLDTNDRAFVENEIRLSEESHAAITKRHFGINWQEAERYDLVVNTERLTIDECVDEVMELYGDAHFQETPASQALFGDLALRAHVRAALRADPRTSKMEVTVEVQDRVATLAGIVPPDLDPNEATEVAGAVKNIKAVHNQIKIAAPSRLKLGM